MEYGLNVFWLVFFSVILIFLCHSEPFPVILSVSEESPERSEGQLQEIKRQKIAKVFFGIFEDKMLLTLLLPRPRSFGFASG